MVCVCGVCVCVCVYLSYFFNCVCVCVWPACMHAGVSGWGGGGVWGRCKCVRVIDRRHSLTKTLVTELNPK